MIENSEKTSPLHMYWLPLHAHFSRMNSPVNQICFFNSFHGNSVEISSWVSKLEIYREIPKISPMAYIFQRPFLMGLFLEGLIYGGKIEFQNRLGLYSEGSLCLKIHWASL